MSGVLHYALTRRISPMAYVMMWVSAFIGFCFSTGAFVSNQESMLYNVGVILDRNVWGVILVITSSVALAGMFAQNKTLTLAGTFVGFIVWGFACVSLLMEKELYIFVTVAVFHLLFHAYVYLATTLNILERTEARDKKYPI